MTTTTPGKLPPRVRLQMKLRNAGQWAAILSACEVAPNTARRWANTMPLVMRPDTFSAGDLDLIDFLPEVIHESAGLERLEESLNYSPMGLLETFGTHRITPAEADRFGRTQKHPADQRAIANIVYGGKYGREKLGNVKPDDGWTFRGRSPIQITGRYNYERMGDLMRQDLTSVPDLLAQPFYGLTSSVYWWEDRIPDAMLGETTTIRKRVNGGQIGLARVQHLTDLVRRALLAEAEADL
jgi:putative chitinase